METLESSLSFRRRISYSLLGLFAGDVLMLILFSLITQAWQQPISHFTRAMSFSINCSSFSWVVVGVPAVILINTAFVDKLKWYYEVLTGALLGSIALLIIHMMVGHFPPGQPGGAAFYWIFATFVSTVAFSLYCALVRQGLRQQEKRNALLEKVEPPLDILRAPTRVDIYRAEPPLDIYRTEWLDTLESTDPRRSTSPLSRPPDSEPS